MTDYSNTISILKPNEKQRVELQTGLEEIAWKYESHFILDGEAGKGRGDEEDQFKKKQYSRNRDKLVTMANKLSKLADLRENHRVKVIPWLIQPTNGLVGARAELFEAHKAIMAAIAKYEVVLADGNLSPTDPHHTLRDNILRLVKYTMGRQLNIKKDSDFAAKAYKAICKLEITPDTINKRVTEINKE